MWKERSRSRCVGEAETQRKRERERQMKLRRVGEGGFPCGASYIYTHGRHFVGGELIRNTKKRRHFVGFLCVSFL